ncbi:glycosyltransferase family 4 protein [candidate division NPL-UPA2 bacterium]|nr:glycosyltransferase family 4 protein [candidate division NPL-UPA2 bacterium]
MVRKIRILHIITRLILGGAQENTVLTVEGLKKRYEVDLVTGPPRGPEGSLVEEAEKRGIYSLIILEMRREVHPGRDLLAFIKLYRLIKKGRYDIVHTHSSKAGILGRLAARLAGAKIIVHTIHGLPFHEYQSRGVNYFYIFCEKLAALFTDKIITVAEAMTAKALAARIAPEERFITIYSGMDLDRFLEPGVEAADKRKEMGIGPDVPVVGKVARLFPLKGHKYLLEAAAEVSRVYPRVRFLLVGDGILKESLEKQAEKLRIKEKVIFAGLVSQKEIPGLLTAMDIVVHASLWEGLARVLPQALAGSKPVVSFDIDGAREVVKEGETGHLVPAGDSLGLAEAIIDLLGDKEKAKKMGEAGKRLVDPAFRAEVMVDRIAELYEDLFWKQRKA